MTRICSVSDCGRIHYARGWCGKHYLRWRDTGSPTGSRRPSSEQRFWSKVNKTETCWLWLGAPNKRGGYGIFQPSGSKTNLYAHRVSYALLVEKIPSSVQLDHICHTPLCVNPDHLRPVDHKKNAENHRGALRTSKTGIRGVFKHSCGNRWHVQVRHHGHTYHGGLFVNISDAEAAAIALRNKLFTHNEFDRVAT